MAYFSGTVQSQVLQMKTGLNVITPVDILKDDRKYPGVYLLHGLSDNCYDWNENTQLTLLANTYGIAFIIPEVQRSFYTDMAYGLKYFTYVADELPQIAQRLFPISGRREHSYVMGLSMGGYGALKCVFLRPDRFAGCGAFSAACSLKACVQMADESQEKELKAAFGINLEHLEENELTTLAMQCISQGFQPDIFMTCGTDDFIYQMSVDFAAFLDKIGMPYEFQKWPGVHEWYLWNKSLHLACAHFFTKQQDDYCNIQ